jgi:uncharacterized protein YjbJ (UPF0337 family)
MNWDQIEGRWKVMKGQVQKKWGQLTEDELDVIAGQRDQSVGKLQQCYGLARDEAERQIREFEQSCRC